MTRPTPQDGIIADDNPAQDLCGNLRQMIAVLEAERQALATLQPDTLLAVTQEKEGFCDLLLGIGSEAITAEARALAQTAKSLNDVNRRVRNLVAANVSGRLEALGAQSGTQRHSYTAPYAISQ